MTFTNSQLRGNTQLRLQTLLPMRSKVRILLLHRLKSQILKENNISIAAIVLLALIFLSIVPLASEDVWNESLVISIIFLLSGIWSFRNRPQEINLEFRQVAAPLLALAAYSLFQGFSQLLLPEGFYGSGYIFPGSYDPTASIWAAFKILSLACFLILLSTSFRHNLKLLVWHLVVTGNFFALFGILRFIFQASYPELFADILSSRLADGIGFGTFYNQNHFAFLMLMVLGLNISFVRYGTIPRGTRFFLLIGSLVSLTAIILTGSRGGMAASFFEITILILLPVVLNVDNKHRTSGARLPGLVRGLKSLGIIALLFGSFIVGIALIGQERVVERIERIPQQLGGITGAATFRRTDVWPAVIAIIRDHPIFGVGLGGFQVAVSRYIDISGEVAPKQAHDDYLELAASAGILGVSIGFWFLFRFIAVVRRRFSESSKRFSTVARIGAILGIVGVATHSFFDFGLQILANQLFFFSLIYIAVHGHQVEAVSGNETSAIKSRISLKYLLMVVFFFLCCIGAYYGLARYAGSQAKSDRDASFVEKKLWKIPFDATYRETRADILENLGDYSTAASEIKTAVVYRPNDYQLWSSLAKLEQKQNHSSEADIAFLRAIELAPKYAGPHLNYGNFLLETGRRSDGLAELRFAALRNPVYFGEVLRLIWTDKSGNIDEVVGSLQPLSENEIQLFTQFLIQTENDEALARVGCGELPVNESLRDLLVTTLLERRRFRFAEQVQKQNCLSSGTGEIEDGGFDNPHLKRGDGFGWRFYSSSENTNITLDTDNDRRSRKSLRFDFSGQDDSTVLLSQTVPVGPNLRYELSFSYKTKGIVTGGVPVVEVILKQRDSDIVAGEANFYIKENGWVNPSIKFETRQATEAVEIRLARRTCNGALCPIFGSLWLDDFALKRLN